MARLFSRVISIITLCILFCRLSVALPATSLDLEPRWRPWKKKLHCTRVVFTIDHQSPCSSVDRDVLKESIDETFVEYAGICRGQETYQNMRIPTVDGVSCRVFVFFPRAGKGTDIGGNVGSNLLGTKGWNVTSARGDGDVHCKGACIW